MSLENIKIENLTVSPLNVRKYDAKDCGDLIVSIQALGLLQPLLVRPVEDGRYEVIAGQRRLNALRAIDAKTEGEFEPVPCLVMGEGDDAAAIEASLAENIERLPMDEVDQYKAFAKLVKEGRTVDGIAATFGITERLVTQRLALGRLHGPILTAYRHGDLFDRDVQTLTMATLKQQKAWWALVTDHEAFVPTGQGLKDWLFGGAHIPVENALFDVETSGLAVVSDPFGEEAYFADCEAFWGLQKQAIAERVEAFRAEGWQEVVVMETGAYFATWDHRTTPKAEDGKVFITCSAKGEVNVHEGYITQAEARRRDKSQTPEAVKPKPELTKAAQNYVDLHRHAAVRADLLGQSGLALRLIAAHMICGSELWTVRVEPQAAIKDVTAESLATNKGQIAMATERDAIAALLAIPETDDIYRPSMDQVFAVLQRLSDSEVTRVLTFYMAETLSVHAPLIDTLGAALGTTIRDHWAPDATFFDLIRDKHTLNAMVAEYAGEAVAAANASETAKTLRAILCACIEGSRTPADPNWTPRYMAFAQGGDQEQADSADPRDQRCAA